MKTVSNSYEGLGRSPVAVLSITALVLVGGAFAAFPLLAQEKLSAPPAPVAVTAEAPAMDDAASLEVKADNSVVGAAQSAEPQMSDSVPLQAAPTPISKKTVTDADVNNLLQKDLGGPLVNEQVSTVVKKLQATGGDASMEDMNQARALLARLEVLTDIVEKLAQLQQADRKRKEALAPSPSSVAGLLPSNLLKLSGASSVAGAAMPMVPPQVNYSVTRITGVNGDMSAVINTGKRNTTVRTGDVLPDGSTVREITNQGVRVRKNSGAERMLRVSAPVAMNDDKE